MATALSDKDEAHLRRREGLIRRWPWVLVPLLVLFLGLGIYAWFRVPLLFNPWAAIAALEAGSIEDTTLMMMAMMLPIAMLATFGLSLCLLLFLAVGLSNEGRLIRIIRRLQARS